MSPIFAHSAGGVVIGPHGKVLVVEQRDHSWSLPKGHMQEGEVPRETAEREILEESGVQNLQFVRILISYSRYALSNTGMENTDSLKRITLYLFTTAQDELQPIDPHSLAAVWMEPRAVTEKLTHPRDQEAYLQILPDIEAFIVEQRSSSL